MRLNANGLIPKKFTCKDDRVLSLYAQARIGSAELPLNNRRLEARRKNPELGTKNKSVHLSVIKCIDR